ncbi:MAG TPA: DUF692 family protein [Polyangia bacterium]|nr:DUF692 family protein [Polyangia bacterium]
MTRFVGGGVGYRRVHRAALLAPGPGPELLEIMPEHFFAAPAEIEPLAGRYPLVFHSVGLSVGTAAGDQAGDAVTRAALGRVRELTRRARPLFVSDHLAFTRSPGGIDLGHLCPLPCTEETYALVAARVRAWQAIIEAPIALENIAHPFRWPGDTMTEAQLFRRLTAETGCGLLLDLTNLLYDARNFGGAPADLLVQYPLEAVWGVHLAGGVEGSDRFWNDTHDQAVDEEAYALLRRVARLPALRAVVVERDGRVPPLGELCAEARRAAEIVKGA